MKYALFAALSIFSAFAAASPASGTTDPAPQAVQYVYGQKLDIAKVVSMTSNGDISTECGPVEAHMVYVDSQGQTHNLAYTRLGEGCQSG